MAGGGGGDPGVTDLSPSRKLGVILGAVPASAREIHVGGLERLPPRWNHPYALIRHHTEQNGSMRRDSVRTKGQKVKVNKYHKDEKIDCDNIYQMSHTLPTESVKFLYSETHVFNK